MRDHHGGMRDHHGGARQFFEKIRFGLLKLRCNLVSVRKNQIWSVEIKVRPGQTVGEGAVAGLPGMNRPPLHLHLDFGDGPGPEGLGPGQAAGRHGGHGSEGC